ncbi:hypothetical protein I5L01_09255 [Erythrobacter sp. YJ-T3-07]|uniref:hypothetical protein n=1 Tax=Erythrobacter sp. YJ-T3-07 TaxID=2793063 RepID=UPI0018D4CAD8|nr:hypothetical protein [Erythrobacter sp. YJ-T3-07]MBH1944419.1 hypothetical protein [Erythrobacter sp. YJ-T3-07]
MAKSLQERIASARSTDRVTIETLEQLIADIELEQDRLSTAHEQASAESIDFALNEDDRDEAAAKAAKYSRDIAGLAKLLPQFIGKLEQKRESDTQQAKRAEARAALVQRDEISARFAERVPAIVSELIDLFEAVNANAERMRLAGVHEANAEWHARGIPGNGMMEVNSAEAFVKLKLPNFDGAGRAWPKTRAAVAEFDYGKAMRDSRLEREKREERARRAAAEHNRLHGAYRLSTGLVGKPVILPSQVAEQHNLPRSLFYGTPWTGEIAHAVAVELRDVPHLNVEAIGGEQEQ